MKQTSPIKAIQGIGSERKLAVERFTFEKNNEQKYCIEVISPNTTYKLPLLSRQELELILEMVDLIDEEIKK